MNQYEKLLDEPQTFKESTDFHESPVTLGDENIVAYLTKLSLDGRSFDEKVLDCSTSCNYQQYHKLFLSENKDMEQNILWTAGSIRVMTSRGEEIKSYSKGYSNLGGTELLHKMEGDIEKVAEKFIGEYVAAGNYTVILSGKNVDELLSYYVNRSCVSMIYPKYSNYQVGTKVQGDTVTGDLLNITLKTTKPYSDEGIRMIDRPLLKNGILKTIHGNSRFSYYLGLKPTGNYESIFVPSGNQSLNEMKAGKYLHIINFSDFQMDSLSGHFAGEIRLAFLCDGNSITPVTGGSINGNLLIAQKNLTFSKEMQIEEGYEGPLAVSLKNISVAGLNI